MARKQSDATRRAHKAERRAERSTERETLLAVRARQATLIPRTNWCFLAGVTLGVFGLLGIGVGLALWLTGESGSTGFIAGTVAFGCGTLLRGIGSLGSELNRIAFHITEHLR